MPKKPKGVIKSTSAGADYASTGQYTKEIICIECGAKRKVKPQDAWQVKRCIPCQAKKKGAKLKEMVEKKGSPQEKRKDAEKRNFAKLDEYVRKNDEDVAHFVAFRKRLDEEHKKRPKLKRVWP